MGKLTSLIVGFVAVCAISFYFLSGSYSGLINWFGPVFGSQMFYAAGLLYLFFGNPGFYPAVLLSWILVGFIVALGSRRGLRAAGAAVSVFFLSLAFFGTVAVSLILPLVSGNSSGPSISSIPPPPPGTSLVSLTSAPVISGLISLLETFVSGLNPANLLPISGGGFSPAVSLPGQSTNIPLNQLLSLFLYPFIFNLITVSVSAGLFGMLFRRLSGKHRSRPGATKAAIVFVVALLMIVSFALISAPNFNGDSQGGTAIYGHSSGTASLSFSKGVANEFLPLASATSGDPYYEALGSYVTTQGSTYSFYAFAHTYNGGGLQASSFFNNSGVSDSAMTLLMTSSGLSSFAYGNIMLGNNSFLPSTGQSSLLNLLPPTVLVSIYPGSAKSTSSAFKSVASSVDSSLGISLSRMLVYDLNATSGSEYTIYIYGANDAMTGIASNYESYAVNGFSNNGLISVFQGGFSTGSVIPGATPSSVDGSVLFSAYMNTADSSLINNLGNVTFGHEHLAVTGAFTVKNHVFHSSSSSQTISLADTLEYSGTMRYSSGTSGSLVLLGVPNVKSGTSPSQIPENITAYMSNSFTLSMLPFNTSDVNSLNYTSAGINPASMSLVSKWTYPRALAANVSMSSDSSGKVTVTTSIRNNDDVSVSGITVNVGNFSQFYKSGTSNISRSTNFTIAQLSPGAMENLTFSFIPSGTGSYTIPFVSVSYSEYIVSLGRSITVNDTFSGGSIQVKSGNFVTVANYVEYSSIHALTNYTSFLSYFIIELFPGFYLFDLVLVLFVVLDGYIEWRAFKKSREDIQED